MILNNCHLQVARYGIPTVLVQEMTEDCTLAGRVARRETPSQVAGNLDRDLGSDPGSTDIFVFNCKLLIIVKDTSAEIIGSVAQFREEERPSMIATVRLAMPAEF